ncbi:MAG: hypothetical protein ACC662_03875, partial [Planctomycetota bacterium]
MSVPRGSVAWAESGFCGESLPQAPEPMRRRILPDPLAAAEGAEVLRRSRYRSTARLPPAGDAPPLLLKAHRVRTAREGWLPRGRRSPGRAEGDAARALGRARTPNALQLLRG